MKRLLIALFTIGIIGFSLQGVFAESEPDPCYYSAAIQEADTNNDGELSDVETDRAVEDWIHGVKADIYTDHSINNEVIPYWTKQCIKEFSEPDPDPEPGEELPNRAPVARFDFSPTNPETGDFIRFDAADSYDSDGDVVRYEWSVLNAQTQGQQFTYSFNQSGVYTVHLRVVDNDGATSESEKRITVTEKPVEPTPEPEPGEPAPACPVEYTDAVEAADTNDNKLISDSEIRVAQQAAEFDLVQAQIEFDFTVDNVNNEVFPYWAACKDPNPGNIINQKEPDPAVKRVFGTDKDSQDLNGDGLHEDPNGNGVAEYSDCTLIAEHYRDPVLQRNAKFYDFDGNGRLNFRDSVVCTNDVIDGEGGRKGC